jgi:hypothetical protein
MFNEPVDPVALGLPDYFQVVEDPLDLGTIQRSIEYGFYLQTGRDGSSGLRRVIEDVSVVWSNAVLYNPPESEVHKLALEFKAASDTQFEKLSAELDPAAERALCERLGLSGCQPEQLVMDRYMFLDDDGRMIAPEDLLQQGVRSSRLVGSLVRRGGGSCPPADAPTDLEAVWELRPVAWHFQLPEPMSKAAAAEAEPVVAWVRTETSWVRLLRPAEDWAKCAGLWLDRVWACLLFRRCLGDAPRDPYEKLLRSLTKAAADGRPVPRGADGAPRCEDSRVRDALFDLAEYAAVCAEQCQRSAPTKLGDKELRRLIARLLEDAGKHRAAPPPGDGAGPETTEGGGEGAARADAPAAVGDGPSRALDVDKVRAVVEGDLAAIERLRSRGPDGGAADGDGDGDEGGYWERDAEGRRHWVRFDAAAPAKASFGQAKPAKRKSAPPPPPPPDEAEGDGGRPKRSVAETLAEEPLVCRVGARVRVLFDDQVWYAGNVTDYDPAAKTWHVVFADEDEDDVGFPDPDVVLLPSVELMLQVAPRERRERKGFITSRRWDQMRNTGRGRCSLACQGVSGGRPT